MVNSLLNNKVLDKKKSNNSMDKILNFFKVGVFSTLLASNPVAAKDTNPINVGPDLASNVEGGKTNLKGNITPQGGGISYQGEKSRLEGELKLALDSIKDSRMKISLQQFLDIARKYGVYISGESGKDINKFSLAGVVKVEGGLIKVSGAFLQKMMTFDFQEFDKKFDKKISQTSYGIDYQKDFDNEFVKNLVVSIVGHTTQNKEFGKIGDRIFDDFSKYEWFEVYGGARGANALNTSIGVDLKIHETIKLSPSVGKEDIKYKKIGNSSGSKVKKTTYGVDIVHQSLDDKNQISLGYNKTGVGEEYNIKYGHKLNNSVETYVEAKHIQAKGGIKSDSMIHAGIKIPLGGSKSSKYSPLFTKYSDKKSLDFSDLKANQKVETEQVYVQQASWEERIVYVDKTSLWAGDSLEKNPDGTLKSLILDNGGFAISSIDAFNDSSYSPFFAINGGKLSIINFKGLNAHMASQGLNTGDVKNIRIGVTDSGGYSVYSADIAKGSVEIKATIQRVHELTQALVFQFIAGTIATIEELKIEAEKLKTDTPSIVSGPTSSDVTHNSLTIVNHISDSDGMRNITYYLYSDLSGTNLLDQNNTGNFSGLSASTTYYIKTSAETLNKATNTWELQTSQILSVSTNAAPVETPSKPNITTSGLLTKDKSQTVNWNAVDGATSYEYRLNNGSWNETTSTSMNITLSEGENTFYLKAKNSGGESDITEKAFVLDSVAPTKSSENFQTLDTKGASFSGTMTFDEEVIFVSATIAEGGSISYASGNGTPTLSFSGVAPNADTATLTIVVEDQAGNQTTVNLDSRDLY